MKKPYFSTLDSHSSAAKYRREMIIFLSRPFHLRQKSVGAGVFGSFRRFSRENDSARVKLKVYTRAMI